MLCLIIIILYVEKIGSSTRWFSFTWHPCLLTCKHFEKCGYKIHVLYIKKNYLNELVVLIHWFEGPACCTVCGHPAQACFVGFISSLRKKTWWVRLDMGQRSLQICALEVLGNKIGQRQTEGATCVCLSVRMREGTIGQWWRKWIIVVVLWLPFTPQR